MFIAFVSALRKWILYEFVKIKSLVNKIHNKSFQTHFSTLHIQNT